jgi:hypothetical protein
MSDKAYKLPFFNDISIFIIFFSALKISNHVTIKKSKFIRVHNHFVHLDSRTLQEYKSEAIKIYLVSSIIENAMH